MTSMRTITEIESLELLHGITDGEWETSRAVSYHNNIPTVTEACVQRRGESVAIASEIIDPETGNVSEANARIMAAAPDLARTNVALYREIVTMRSVVKDYIAMINSGEPVTREFVRRVDVSSAALAAIAGGNL